MKTLSANLACVIGSLLFASAQVCEAANIPQKQIRFERGMSIVSVDGKIKGNQSIDYLLNAKSGESLKIDFITNRLSAYFSVLPPASDEAIFIGSILGKHYEGPVSMDGKYRIRVHLMGSDARSNDFARYKLTVSLDSSPAASVAGQDLSSPAFDKTLDMEGISFHVTCANAGSVNTLRIVPHGLETDDSPVERSIDGIVSGAEVADLNGDGLPEIYVYIRSTGSGSYGSMVAYAVTRRKSLTEIYMPPLTEREGAIQGYMGHDEFTVRDGAVNRRFPVYRSTDTNANPTGGMRQFQYKLKPGETNWNLQIDKSFEF